MQRSNGLGTAWRFLTDPKAGRWSKVLLALAVLYVVFPFDFVPDVVVVIGWLDDLAALGVAVTGLLVAWQRHKAQVAGASPPTIAPYSIDTTGTEVR